ncbi:MAG: DUF3089 domain-containing protein [Solirubrobacteraceae bacterium]
MIRTGARLATLVAAVVIALTLAAQAADASVVWLCKPGQHPDPCTAGLSTTVYSPTLRKLRVAHPRAVRDPKIDCFYVYPTVSDQTTDNANLEIDPEERSIALYQAARYSQYCRVFAPVYRQVTVPALLRVESGQSLSASALQLPMTDVLNAFETYLHRYNHGRGFVLIGHSQGSLVLEQVIAKAVDSKPAVRKRMLSAILLGGNVLVKRGRAVGGTFHHIPACQSDVQLSCVIAYSTFDQAPPADSLFGRTSVAGERVLCTNPAALLGASTVDPIFPARPFAPGSLLAGWISLMGLKQPMPATVWGTEPGAYRARCESVAGANVLELTALRGAQVAQPSPTPEWGLHLLDANIELGDLVTLVSREAHAFARRGLVPLAHATLRK